MGLFDKVHYGNDADCVPNLQRFCEDAAEKLGITTSVIVVVANMPRAMGRYFPKGNGIRSEIKISSYIVGNESQLRETIFHEFCHHKARELTGFADHGLVWKKCMVHVGYTPNRYAPCRAEEVAEAARSSRTR